MREYELVFLIADAIAEDKQTAVLAKIKKFISDFGGEVTTENNLGRRRLAYIILKNEFAFYYQLNFKLEGKDINEFERDVRLMPEVIRHLLTLQKAGHISVLDEKIEAVADKDLEAVIGEKSFEQVEGQTEDSYSLMAKREETTEEPFDSAQGRPKKLETEEPKNLKTKELEKSQISVEQKAKKIETSDRPVEKIEQEKENEKVDVKPKAKKIAKDKVEKSVELAEEIEKPVKKEITKPKKSDKELAIEDESERLRKLDDKLDEILGDDI